MKKLFIMLIVLLSLSACQKEKTEKERFNDLNVQLKKEVNTKSFKEEIYPNIIELYALNPKKYSLIKNIADKASSQKNPDIFKINVSDLKSEMKFIK